MMSASIRNGHDHRRTRPQRQAAAAGGRLIDLPLTNRSRRIRPIVSTISIPHRPLAQNEQAARSNDTEGVNFGRRSTPSRGQSCTPKHTRQIVPFREAMQGLAAEIFLSDLAFELEAVGAVSGHGLSSSKARLPGQLLSSSLSGSRGPLQSRGNIERRLTNPTSPAARTLLHPRQTA